MGLLLFDVVVVFAGMGLIDTVVVLTATGLLLDGGEVVDGFAGSKVFVEMGLLLDVAVLAATELLLDAAEVEVFAAAAISLVSLFSLSLLFSYLSPSPENREVRGRGGSRNLPLRQYRYPALRFVHPALISVFSALKASKLILYSAWIPAQPVM